MTLTAPAVTQRSDQRLFDDSHLFAVRTIDQPSYLLNRQQALLNLAQLLAIHIFKDKRLADAQRLAIHFEDFLTFLVFDPEIISDGDQLLTYFVTSWSYGFLLCEIVNFSNSIIIDTLSYHASCILCIHQTSSESRDI